jgi:hypothetical protein
MDTIQGFGSGRPYVLRPALVVERLSIRDSSGSRELVAYPFIAYSWIAKSFQQSETLSNLHFPR